MTRLLMLVAVFGTTSIPATIAHADDYARRGTRGTVTAYELDGRTVIGHRTCLPSGRYSWDYVRCGEHLHDHVKLELCHRLGNGTHHFLYQIGDGRPYRSSVSCR
jgi:hypothetical protein